MDIKKQQNPCVIMRGGTSKGVYILEKDMPAEREKWDSLLLRIMGSPDKKQIDGLGGSQSVTSKVAIVGPSSRPDADVDYTFAQVSVDKPIVSYKGNCGNISSGVGPFAIETGLVEAREGQTTVRIYNTNTDKIIAADIRTENGRVVYEGDFAIAGVPGTASPIRLKFVDPAGTLGKGLLPTGSPVDVLEVPDLMPAPQGAGIFAFRGGNGGLLRLALGEQFCTRRRSVGPRPGVPGDVRKKVQRFSFDGLTICPQYFIMLPY